MSLSAYPFSQGRPRCATEISTPCAYKHLKDTAHLDRNGGSLAHFGVRLPSRVSRSEIASTVGTQMPPSYQLSKTVFHYSHTIE